MKRVTEKTLRGFSFSVLSFIVPAVLLLQGCPNPSVTAPPTPSGAPKIEHSNPETGPTADASAGSAVKDVEGRVIGTIIIQKDASGNINRKLKISPSLTAVTASAFSGLNLTSVIIPASVKSIGPRAFAVNPNLQSVTISQSLLNSTNPNAFPAGVSFKDGVGGLISSSLKNNPIIEDTEGSKITVTVDGSGKTVFKSLEVSPKLTAILAAKFANQGLTSVLIPEGVTGISAGAFMGNPGLTSVTLSQELLNTLDIPATPAGQFSASVDSGAVNFQAAGAGGDPGFPPNVVFSNYQGKVITPWKEMAPVTDADGSVTTITRDKNGAGRIVAKSLLVSSRLTSIPANKFANQELTAVTVPTSVTKIDSRAFANNPNLKSVTISQQLLNNTPVGTFPAGTVFRHHSGRVITQGDVARAPGRENTRRIPGPEGFVTIVVKDANNGVISRTLEVASSVTSIKYGQFQNKGLTHVKFITPSSLSSIRGNAFANNKITRITIPNSVIDIGGHAFAENRLSSLTISDFVNYIGDSAFRGNQLTTLDIPNSVNSIEQFAFADNQIASLTIGNSLTTIEQYAFYNNRLTTLTIPSSITSIKPSAFRSNRLTTLTIPSSITSIGDKQFAANPDLKSITIAQKLLNDTPAGAFPVDAVFKNHSGTVITRWVTERIPGPHGFVTIVVKDGNNTVISKTLEVGSSVGSIGYELFRSKELTHINFIAPSSLISIEEWAFEDNRLTSLTIPKSVTWIGHGAFADNPDLKSITISQKLLNDTPAVAFPAGAVFKNHSGTVITRWVTERIPGPNGFVTIVVKDGNNAVSRKTLEVGSSVTSIADAQTGSTGIVTGLFQGKGITHVNFIAPSSLSYIGSDAFSNNRLTSVTIPSSVTTIGISAFSYNDLTAVTIPSSVTTIKTSAFSYNRLIGVTIPSSVTTIEMSAFSNNRLTSVTIPNSVTTIGVGAFAGNRLTTVTIPNSVTTIGTDAFAGNRLTTVTIPSSVTTIGNHAFYNNRLTTVTIPNSVTTIGVGAFQYNRLTTVSISSSVTTIGNHAFYNNRLTTVTIPSSVTTIGVGAFADNRLTTVTIPSSVTTIGTEAFSINRLTTVTIPSSVTTIGEQAFWNNPLTSVTISQSLLNSAPANAFPSSGVTFKDHSGNTITRK